MDNEKKGGLLGGLFGKKDKDLPVDGIYDGSAKTAETVQETVEKAAEAVQESTEVTAADSGITLTLDGVKIADIVSDIEAKSQAETAAPAEEEKTAVIPSVSEESTVIPELEGLSVPVLEADEKVPEAPEAELPAAAESEVPSENEPAVTPTVSENAVEFSPDLKKRKRQYKKLARKEAKNYRAEKKTAGDKDSVKAVKKAWKQKKKDWKKTWRHIEDKEEKKIQKKAYKAFKKRKKIVSRLIGWVLLLAILFSLVFFGGPTVKQLFGVLTSQKYTGKGAAADSVRAAGAALADEICADGFVLLKNDDGVLPLNGTKINVFGDDAYNFVYGASGSAGADSSDSLSFFDALTIAGIEYNKELNEEYLDKLGEAGSADNKMLKSISSAFGGKNDGDDWILIENDDIAEAKAYSNTAVIVLSSMEVEGMELSPALLQPMSAKLPNRAAMIDKVCTEFEHVIFIINSGNVMELGFVNDYPSADAVLWVGAPGSDGCSVIAKVLKGEINPSGRTVDTWMTSIEAEPSFQTHGDYKYSNSKMHTMEYSEGIYVGYRYWETRFGNDAAKYAENVVFPFGSGLSYTDFSEKITGVSNDEQLINVEVEVKNTGKTAGKDVVELYFAAPYNEASGIEKSAIELAAFAKTSELAPGKSETVTLTYEIRDMASWDGSGYVLEAGEYKVAIGKNVHEALLARDEDQQQVFTVDKAIRFDTDSATGVKLQSLFGFAEGETTYLSRADWEGTFPTVPKKYTISAETLEAVADYLRYSSEAENVPTFGADNKIVLQQLKGLDYDDPLWDSFLDEFTPEEMIKLCANGGWYTAGIERLGIKQGHQLDGPSGINSMYSNLEATIYPMETVVAATWNPDFAKRLGEAIGNEAQVYGVNGWYAPAMNLHRCAIGGRNSEYYSEDPMLSGAMAAATVNGIQSKGVTAYIKHLVCNDVELNARSGIYLWVNEQALRELYLSPFEQAVKYGNAGGVMSSFSHLGYKWCGACPELLQDLLREEWGFEGTVTTDAVLGDFMNAEGAVKAGNDLMLEMGLQQSEKKLTKAFAEDPAGVGTGLRNSVHDICYTLVNSSLY